MALAGMGGMGGGVMGLGGGLGGAAGLGGLPPGMQGSSFATGPEMPSYTPEVLTERKAVVQITISGVKGTEDYEAAVQLKAKVEKRGGTSRRVAFDVISSADTAAFAAWLKEVKEWRTELGEAAAAHGTDSVFLAISSKYVTDVESLRKEISALLGKKVSKKRRAARDWNDAPPDVKPGRCGEHTATITLIFMVVCLVAVIFGGLQLALISHKGGFEFIGIPASARHYREKLEAFYAEHNPEKLKKPMHISSVLMKNRGKEIQLFKKLERVYAKRKAAAAAAAADSPAASAEASPNQGAAGTKGEL